MHVLDEQGGLVGAGEMADQSATARAGHQGRGVNGTDRAVAQQFSRGAGPSTTRFTGDRSVLPHATRSVCPHARAGLRARLTGNRHAGQIERSHPEEGATGTAGHPPTDDLHHVARHQCKLRSALVCTQIGGQCAKGSEVRGREDVGGKGIGQQQIVTDRDHGDIAPGRDTLKRLHHRRLPRPRPLEETLLDIARDPVDEWREQRIDGRFEVAHADDPLQPPRDGMEDGPPIAADRAELLEEVFGGIDDDAVPDLERGTERGGAHRVLAELGAVDRAHRFQCLLDLDPTERAGHEPGVGIHQQQSRVGLGQLMCDGVDDRSGGAQQRVLGR